MSNNFHSPFLFGACAIALLLVGLQQEPAATAPTPAQSPLRILITNDDGIDTPGIAALVTAFTPMGEVVVAAPDGNRSGASQSSHVFSEILTAVPREMDGAAQAWALSGTPSDCAAYGIIAFGGEQGFDLVVSGINRGSNVGDVAHYSGTVGAATEAAMRGIPAIAISEDGKIQDHSVSAEFTAAFAAKLLEEGGTPGVMYNINVPSAQPKGVKVAPMGGLYLGIEEFARKDEEDGSHRAKANIKWNRTPPEGTDTAAYQEGFISIAPLKVDWTDYGLVETVGGWGLSVSD
ncbi:MAG: 5'/3'-nucleotidase SurE [Planctomycetota bacterium]|jgi:5'-nucleotidase